jgi:hypothetical protein
MKLALAAAACLSFLGHAQDKEKLREALKDNVVKGDWIYDDLDAGYAAARKSGKPMLIVFR